MSIGLLSFAKSSTYLFLCGRAYALTEHHAEAENEENLLDLHCSVFISQYTAAVIEPIAMDLG